MTCLKSKFSSEEFSASDNILFGEEFQSKLISKKQKDKSFAPPKSKGIRLSFFYEKPPPPGKYGDRWHKNFQPYTQYAGENRTLPEDTTCKTIKLNNITNQDRNVRRLATPPLIAGSPETTTEKVLEVLHSLPQTLLPGLGMSLDMDIAR